MTLVFLHIDKTGGMSLREVLASKFARSEIMPVPHHPASSVQPDNYPVADHDLTDINRRFPDFYRNRGYQLVMGHYDWSIIQYVQNPTVITVLRDPVERFASLYRYICEQNDLYPQFSEIARSMTMLEFAKRYSILYENVMTMQLAGHRWVDTGYWNDTVYQIAVQNLHQCDFVGTTPNLHRFTDHLHEQMKWTKVSIKHLNQTSSAGAVDDETAEHVRKVSKWDVKLFDIARGIEEHAIQQGTQYQ